MTMDLELLRQELTRDEGLRSKPYKDSVGKLTIGIGHNLDDKGLSDAAIRFIFEEDVYDHMVLLDKHLTWWRQLDEVRQRVVLNMAFNMGVGPSAEDPKGKLLTFKNTLGHMERGQYELAADGMAGSAWAKQVGIRADRLVSMMRQGTA